MSRDARLEEVCTVTIMEGLGSTLKMLGDQIRFGDVGLISEVAYDVELWKRKWGRCMAEVQLQRCVFRVVVQFNLTDQIAESFNVCREPEWH